MRFQDIPVAKITHKGEQPLDKIDFYELHNDGESIFLSSAEFSTEEMRYHLTINSFCRDGQLQVILSVVKAFEDLPKKIQKAIKDEITDDPDIYDIQQYGAFAPVERWSYGCIEENEDNVTKVGIDAARDKAPRVKLLLGFYLDVVLNRIGSTGWDFLDGNYMGILKANEEE